MKYLLKPPQKIPAWTGELQATKVSDACLQYTHLPAVENERVEGSEDCLYLNIYVPVRKADTARFPVILWIHGGCFQYGTGNIFGAKYLADKDVILVTINYRLGSLGDQISILVTFGHKKFHKTNQYIYCVYRVSKHRR